MHVERRRNTKSDVYVEITVCDILSGLKAGYGLGVSMDLAVGKAAGDDWVVRIHDELS